MYKIAILSVLSMVNASDSWSYRDTSNSAWGAVTVTAHEGSMIIPNYCNGATPIGSVTTVKQSPIDINTNTVARCLNNDPDESKLEWEYDPDVSTFTVINTGHSILINAVDDDEDDVDPMKFKNNFVTASGEHEDYCFTGLHMHWGAETAGTEHKTNGVQAALEIHFVFHSCDYSDIVTAQTAMEPTLSTKIPTDGYTLSVIGVKFTIGAANPFIQKIVDSTSQLANPDDTARITGVSLQQLLPLTSDDDDDAVNKYYHYKGSLTTPPCTPCVAWNMLQATKTISAAQLTALRNNIWIDTTHTDEHLMAPNFRPTQSNDNTVYLCPNDEAGDDGDDG